MKDKELINPIQIGRYNVCPNCTTPSLYLVEKNLDISYIDGEGNPENHKNISHIGNLICMECRQKFNYKKRGTKIFIHTDREERIDNARDILVAEKQLEKYLFARIDTDNEERDDWI